MNDLISRSALNNNLIERHYSLQSMGILYSEYPHMMAIVSKQPAVDAEPVVRCKDCAQWDGSECSIWYGFHENDFCSYGERRNGDATD